MSLVDLIDESMERVGSIEFSLAEKDLFDSSLKEYSVFYKIVGESRMKLFRNNRMELVFVRLNDDWMRQAKVNIGGTEGPLTVKLSWDNDSVDQLAVKQPGEAEFIIATSQQIDN